MPGPRRRILFFAVFFAIQLLALLALLEVGARIFDPRGVSYYPNTAAFMDSMIVEEPIGYRNRPSLEGDFYFHRVTINSAGLRHRELDLVPDPSKYRILMLGDSVVFGVGVGDRDTLPRQLEERLRETVGEVDGREIEVVNMGVISYNTEQEMIQYQQLGRKLGPDLVILLFSENDVEPKMWIFEKRSNSLVAFGQKSYAVSLLFLLWRDLKAAVLADPPRAQPAHQEPHPRWQDTVSAMSELNRMIRDDDVPFIVFSRNKSSASWPLLLGLAGREGFLVEGLLPFHDDRWKHLDPREFWARGGGRHANREGLEMYVTLIEEVIHSVGVLGKTRFHSDRERY